MHMRVRENLDKTNPLKPGDIIISPESGKEVILYEVTLMRNGAGQNVKGVMPVYDKDNHHPTMWHYSRAFSFGYPIERSLYGPENHFR